MIGLLLYKISCIKIATVLNKVTFTFTYLPLLPEPVHVNTDVLRTAFLSKKFQISGIFSDQLGSCRKILFAMPDNAPVPKTYVLGTLNKTFDYPFEHATLGKTLEL